MKATVLPTIEGLLAGSTGMLSLVKQKARLTSTAELLLYSKRMILMKPGLGGSAVVYIVDRLKPHGLRLRDENETLFDAVTRLFSSVLMAPYEVLNFSHPESTRPKHVPLRALDVIHQNESIHSVEDLYTFHVSASDFNEVETVLQIMERLDEWGINIE